MNRTLRLGLGILLGSVLAVVALAGGVIAWQSLRSEDPGVVVPVTDRQAQLAKGQYLARAGNCMACHTVRGGAAYAGGRALPTPFGTIYTTNITPDRANGIGDWSADDFWRALHHGRGRDGRFLFPAFPYTSYTQLSREDSDALFAWLRTLPPVNQPNRSHELRFPYDQRPLLGLWRAFFFTPAVYQPDTARSAQWNRGAYLVRGAGHCSACHSARNVVAASIAPLDLAGGMIPALDWYAPPLHGGEHGLGSWSEADIAALLRTGVSPRGTSLGPMTEIVGRSLQYLNDEDINAMAVYLKSLPAQPLPAASTAAQPEPAEAERILKQGKKLYGELCVDCHGGKGQGSAPDYPPLAGNHAIGGPQPVNAIRAVLNGGFPPSTAGNPYPFGMPPFGPQLSDQEVAALVSYVRNSWGNQGGFVSASDVNRYRSVPLD
ncbi:c-type cytochrome [Herbaspirillum huttiense]|uniref:c-type cytochrome n=1 Tax=Herbaspirillum huttiense TaxID=863372 RepID=UPI0010654351|nr:cytochrome c [Herbaspirillum huttiense]QBP74767.1 c-type cytochrome [Herbaspirillum huttiense]